LLGSLQDLIATLTENQKFAAAQILISHIPATKLVKVSFINQFDDKLHAVFAFASFLPADFLKETAIQILEEQIDRNE
jgi:hypothetical protein